MQLSHRFDISRNMDQSAALAALSALGQDTRLQAFRLLVKAGDEGMPAGEIAARLAVPANTLSTHLRIVEQAGLLRSQREGRVIRYFADFTGMRDLLAFLMEDCCGGRPELCAPVIEAVTCRC